MKSPLSPEEKRLFRAAMAQVSRHRPAPRAPTRAPIPSAKPRSTEADELAVIAELRSGPMEMDPVEGTDALAFRSPGIQDRVWRRLQRGSYRFGAELDLHGLNREAAYREVAAFISDSRARGIRCVRIIHGKGLRSPNSGPVIRKLIDQWLRRRADVLAFCTARPHDGGTGAIYVLLRATASNRF